MSKPNIWRNARIFHLGLALALSLILLMGLLLPLGLTRPPDVALAQGSTVRYVATTGSNSGNDCATSSTPCATIQHAADVADPGDEIRVATGVYTDIHTAIAFGQTITQVVYISKTLTVRGGYTTTFTGPPDPVANPTTLDVQRQGRVLYVSGEISATIEGLRITGGNAELGGAGSVGGGVYVITATITISGNHVFNNNAYSGGGLFIRSSDGVLVSDNAISGNGAVRGGGLHFSNSPNVMLTANTISQNYANSWALGGGLYFENSPNVTLVGNTIINNTALTAVPQISANAGGLYCFGGNNMTLTDNVISSNSAKHAGGGLLFDNCNNIKLGANIISDNTGCCGGGLSVGNSTDVELTNNLISGNTVSREGGGASFIGSDNVTLIANTVIGNDTFFQGPNPADDFGAGLHFADSTNVNLISNTITNNGPTVTFGGGLYLNNSDITMTNNIITDNQAEPGGTGSGLYILSSSPRLLHTTIARNSGGDGSGVHITGTLNTVAMTNTILANHSVGITATAGNTVTLNGVLWYSNTTNYDGDGNIAITNEYTGDPAFATDGYHLTVGSAAIDRGVNAGVNDDIDGDSRPLRCGFDIGADEYDLLCPPPISVTIAGPSLGTVQTNYSFTATANVTTTALPLTYVWQATEQELLTNTGGLSDTVSFNWPTPGIKVITVTAANAGGTVMDTHTINICHQGPTNLPSSATHDLDHEAADWGVFCEGSPTWAKENVTTPSLDGEALRCAITGGEPHSNVHCYRNLLPEPTAVVFTMTTSFLFTPATTCNGEGDPSVVQALEFAINKWQDDKRYEFALQWQNAEEGAPQWRYWDPSQQWVPISPTITQCLEAGKWYTLTLAGEIIDDNVHYKNFMLDQESYPLDITVEPFPILGEPDRLAVAVQLDGNATQSPYDLFIDQVSFVRSARPALEVTKRVEPNLVQPGSPLTYTIHLTNTGNVTLTATIADTLPDHVTPTDTLIWTPGPIAPGGVWMETFVVTTTTDYSGTLTNRVRVTTQEGAAGVAQVKVCVEVCKIYLPLILRLPAAFSLHIGDAIPVRPVAYQGEIFFSTPMQIPDALPAGGRFYFSSQRDAVSEVLVDDELAVLLDGTDVFTYDFSTSGKPEPATVEIPHATMEQLVGRTVSVEYRDIYADVVKASTMWLIWTP